MKKLYNEKKKWMREKERIRYETMCGWLWNNDGDGHGNDDDEG